MDRRRFLAGAATGATAGLAGCGENGPDRRTGTPNGLAESAEPEWSFGRRIDITEKGADRTGNRPIDQVLAEQAGDDTLIYLPPGEYRLESTFSMDGFDRFGLVGQNALITPPEGFSDRLFSLGKPGSASRLLVSGLSFDFEAPETGGRPLLARVDDRLAVSDLSVFGTQDVDSDLFRFDVAARDGTGTIARLRLPDGGKARYDVTGCEVGDDTRGSLSFLDCYVEGFPDNGLYADPPAGAIRVLGGRYLNNGVAGVRVNAGDKSVVRGVHVRCDAAPDGFENMRGIRLRGGNSLLVEDCLVEMLKVTGSDGGITFASELGSAVVRDTRIRVDADGVNAIRIKSPKQTSPGSEQSGPFTIENVVVSGTAADGAAVHVAGRNGCTFDGICLHQPGAKRDGVVCEDVTGAIKHAYIGVTARPLHLVRSDVPTSDVTIDRSPDDELPDTAPCT